jgi:photosystem II stability/assembly factor-like uncharacterized protein
MIMSKFPKLLLIIMILALAGCNKPRVVPKAPPTDTVIPDTSIPQSKPAQTSTIPPTPEPSATIEPGVPPTSPPVPTVDMTQVLSGDPIPLYPAGTEITLREVRMVDDSDGWGIGTGKSDFLHLFRTEDGGITWQDVTPPQPEIISISSYLPITLGVWDSETAWAAYGGTEVIWSTDNGGITWEASLLEHTTTYDGMITVLDKNHAWFFQFLEGGMQKVFTAVSRTSDGGKTWELLLDPYGEYHDESIQAFDKTGAVFINPQFGWLTRDFRGVDPFVRINFTQDGGFTWDSVELPAPPAFPDLFAQNLGALYDPYLISPDQGSFRVFTRRMENEEIIDQDFLYKTSDGGSTWEILDLPGGDLYHINDQIMYTISRDIYRSDDGGVSWQFIKSVNWDGQFSFVDQNTAWVVAYNGYEYALVKTTNGCQSFFEIEPVLVNSSAVR